MPKGRHRNRLDSSCDEKELLEYVKQLEKELKGKTYHIDKGNMDRVLVTDYLSNARKVFTKKQSW